MTGIALRRAARREPMPNKLDGGKAMVTVSAKALILASTVLRRLILPTLFLVAFGATHAFAAVTVWPIFRSNMVLQRGMSCPVFGVGDVGSIKERIRRRQLVGVMQAQRMLASRP
ncbi:MAG: hypothetical protein ACJ754_03760 [Pyrinomonadaceae bacterium]